MTFHLTHWPTDSRYITQHFGENVEDYRKWFGLENGHNGIDIGLWTGDPVYAAADGEVIDFGNDAEGFGNYVLIAHGKEPLVTTLYAHLNEYNVTEWQSVKGGEMIGRGGSTGHSTGPHLHFGLRIDRQDVDPWPYLQAIGEIEPGHDGWLWQASMIIVVGEAPDHGLNLRRNPNVMSELIRLVEAGEQFEVVGDAVNGYLPVRIRVNDS